MIANIISCHISNFFSQCNYEINKNKSISLLRLAPATTISRRDGKGSILSIG